MKIKNRRSRSSKKPIIIVLVLLAVIGGYLAYAWFNHLPPFPAKKESYQPGEQVVNMDRSETEKKASEDLKNNPETKLDNKQTDNPNTPVVDDTTGKQRVNVLLTNTGTFNNKVSASGMVTNAVEEGGTCTFVFTNGSTEVVKNSTTLTNPSSTSCTTVSFPSSELSPGVWKVKIDYSSSASMGESNTKELTVE